MTKHGENHQTGAPPGSSSMARRQPRGWRQRFRRAASALAALAVPGGIMPPVQAAVLAPVLWYAQPAATWEQDALPIGNAYLGGMIFGGIGSERIQFNEESLWLGDESVTGAYQAFGDIFVFLEAKPGSDSVPTYRRDLDLARAIHTVAYQAGGIAYRREAFASYPARIMAFRFTADQPGMLSGTVRLADAHQAKVVAGDGRLTCSGSLAGFRYKEDQPYALALDYEAQVAIRHTGGTVEADGDQLVFKNADAITLLLAAGTDFVADRSRGWKGEPPRAAVAGRINAALPRSWDDLLAEHVRDYQVLFNRVVLDIGGDGDPDIATDVRLKTLHRTGTPDHGLEELLFQYGRYLMIAASRPGSLPANLQGKWCESLQPIWRCDYHTDINVQMNYWPVEVANLSECFQPYADWLNAIRPVRAAATERKFGRRGWLVQTELGLFGGSNWSWSLGSTAWMTQSLYDHYRYTGDRDYLRILAYPAMKELCEYALGVLEELPDGTLVTPPSRSPEQGPAKKGVSYDQQLVWDLFTGAIESSRILDVDPELRRQLMESRDRLSPPRIGQWGQLQEWMEDCDDPINTHRHISHLVGLYPGRQISPRRMPELARAARVSLEARGDGGPGWSRANKMLMWARLRDGERAYDLLRGLLRHCILPNLFATHPPFQIDANFGYLAGVGEMLMQSHESIEDGGWPLGDTTVAAESARRAVPKAEANTGVPIIEILPALPSAWPSGKVAGLRARGGFEVDIRWKEGRLDDAVIRSASGGACLVRYGEAERPVTLAPGDAWRWLKDGTE